MKRNLLISFVLGLTLLPTFVFAAAGKTPPWIALDSDTPSPRGVCSAQGGTFVPVCLNTTTNAVTDRVTGSCPVKGTSLATRCDVKVSATKQDAGAQAPSTNTFVPLTALPGIKDFQTSNSLPNLLNNIYKICIGIAAVLAVLQIMRAGIMYMGGDSITEKKEARDLITMSIVGLILVLSPVIVFSIINPQILELNINADSLVTSPSATPSAPSTATDTSSAACANFTDFTATAAGTSCTKVADQCCAGLQNGYQCCATPK